MSGGGDRYAIPQVSLLELVRLEGDRARHGIEYVHGAPVYRLRGNLLPLVYLNRELGMAAGKEDAVNIVVLQVDGRPFGLVVEAISDTEEIVVKPLSKLLKGLPLYAGATILGDGQVALILDVLGLAQSASVIGEVRRRSLSDAALPAKDAAEVRHQLLLLDAGEDRRVALPLDLVARLEEVPAARVEWAAGHEVLQYRDRILPLVRLGRDGASSAPASLRVVVCGSLEHNVGLVVDRILDVVETPLEMQRSARRDGTLGSAVIQRRVTDLLDVPALLRAAGEAFAPDEGRLQP